MNDTNAEVSKILKQRYDLLSPEDRLKKCSGMYETAKILVLSSLPENLSPKEKKMIFFLRMHGFNLPDGYFEERCKIVTELPVTK